MYEPFGISWPSIGRIAVTTVALYVTVLVLVRIAGRRTVSEISAFDVITTIAMGTVVGSTAVSPAITYTDGVAALVALIVVQVVVGMIRQRVPASQRLLDFSTEPVVRDGQFSLRTVPWSAQLTEAELRSRLRAKGIFDVSAVEVVLLEPDGSISISRARPAAIDDEAT